MLDIDIDVREEPSGIPRLLSERYGGAVHVRSLPVGDYLVGDLGIERKTSLDLVRSIADGRIFDQARRLSRAFPRAALIVEGLFPPPACDGREDAYLGCVSQLSLSLGIYLFPTRFPRDSALLIERFVQAELDRVANPAIRIEERRFSKPRHSTDRRLFLLQGFFGIGPAKARELLKAFGSLHAVFSAPPELWTEVPGIGRKLAGRMSELLHESEPPAEPVVERGRSAG